MSFRISALPAETFAPLFHLSDDALAARGGVRQVADAKPGFPCRVSLADAEIGETLLLVNFEHQPASSPYRSTHAVYVREGALRVRPAPGEVPDVLRRRLLSARAFDATGMMRDADVVEGAALEPVVERLLSGAAVAYVHLHFAKAGCYAARVDRV